MLKFPSLDYTQADSIAASIASFAASIVMQACHKPAGSSLLGGGLLGQQAFIHGQKGPQIQNQCTAQSI
jgi:hypothetical protein